MAKIIPWHSDVVQRPVKFVKSNLTQAAIGIDDGDMILYTDGGTTIGPGRSAATGSGVTVCTDGYIAFGGGCFIASDSSEESAVRRGTVGGGGVDWQPVFSAGGKVRGVSYCGGYFFVTSSKVVGLLGERICYIARGAKGGTQWDESTLDTAQDCGLVAARKTGVDDDGKPIFLYCAAGIGIGDNPNYGHLFSATSSNGLSWGGGVQSGTPSGGSYIGASKDVFVTGGFAYSVVTNESGSLIGTGAAQANVSPNGSDWAGSNMPVPGGSADYSSVGEGAVFVTGRDSKSGYFVAVASESAKNVAYALKSSTGSSWSVIRSWTGGSDGASIAGLSIVGTTLGKIVKI